jgi:hypothetical protein
MHCSLLRDMGKKLRWDTRSGAKRHLCTLANAEVAAITVELANVS